MFLGWKEARGSRRPTVGRGFTSISSRNVGHQWLNFLHQASQAGVLLATLLSLPQSLSQALFKDSWVYQRHFRRISWSQLSVAFC